MLTLSIKSLWNRRFVATLTILSIALSVALVLGVERLRTTAKSGFSNSAVGIDLIVAPRGDQVQILMATVFGIGSTGPGISWDSYEAVATMPEVAWAVPLSMGDNHRGFPVIGTNTEYFQHLRHSGGRLLDFAEGMAFAAPDQAVVGAEVAARFGYGVGTAIINAHGAGEVAFDVHDEAPFTITGILSSTGTAVDRSVFVSLDGFDRLHVAPDRQPSDPFAAIPSEGQTTSGKDLELDEADHGTDHEHHDIAQGSQKSIDHEDRSTGSGDQPHDFGHSHEPEQINAIYVGLSDRGTVLSVQRSVAEFSAEPLSAVLPNVALLQLWSITGIAENALRMMASAVALAGIAGMVVMLSASLEARRREFAILRSVGATPVRVFCLVVLEAVLVTTAAMFVGYILLWAGSGMSDPVLAARFGVRLAVGLPDHQGWLLMCLIFTAGILASMLPAVRVYRMTVADGLSFRV